MAVEITSRDEFEAWLEGKPRDWAQVIALRCALRTLPFAADPTQWKGRSPAAELTKNIFRAIAVSSGARKIPPDDTVANAADAASYAAVYAAVYAASAAADAADAASYAASYAADAAFAASASASAAVYAASAAVSAASAAVSAASAAVSAASAASGAKVWAMISRDCEALANGQSALVLLDEPLWTERPDWFDEAWSNAAAWLSVPESGFKIWREWYYGRLEGLPRAFARFDEEADVAFYQWLIERDDVWWDRDDTAAINAEIAAKVEELRTPPEDTDPKVDFFISYTGKDEAAAREVADVLDELGKSYLVQYRDFAKRDFAVAMNDALSRSERIIPLYSKGYVRSDHCMAEWHHFYKIDPSFEQRKVVGFLLQPTDLPPLMDRVNYKSLMELTGARRRIAIREWIEPSAQRTSRDWVRGVLMSTISPQIVHDNDNKLVLASNPVFDEPEFPAELASALVELRMLLDLVRDQTFNLSSFMQRALTRYDEEIAEAGAGAHWGALDRMMAIVSDGLEQMRDEEFSAGQRSVLVQLISVHNHCMTSLRDPDLRIRDYASIPEINGEAGDVSAVVKGLEGLAVDLKTDDLTSAEFDQHVSDLINEGREFEFEASNLGKGEKPSRSMRRYILSIGGFGFVLLNALGSVASISATPAGKAALAAAQKLVDDFYRIIGL